MEQSAPQHRHASNRRALQPRMHAFSHAPAALRIFRFAADSAPRVLEITHVSAFLRECAVEFGSADAAVPGALRCEYASGRFFKLRAFVERNAARCPWLAAKLLACRSGAPVPAAALALDVTRHDVNWGAEGARRHVDLQLTHDAFGLTLSDACHRVVWAQGAVGATSGKHFFQVSVTAPGYGDVMAGWVDDKLNVKEIDQIGNPGTKSAGCVFHTFGAIYFGTAPLRTEQPVASSITAPANEQPCAVGCLLNLDSTPARMTVFVDGVPLAAQCEYDFPKDGRAWFPSVALWDAETALHSCAM
jgi:hypothetical protein